MWSKVQKHVNIKITFVNAITALLLNLFLEFMERKSLAEVWQFIGERSFMFLYNTLIIMLVLCPVYFMKKKYFSYVFMAGLVALIGLCNGIILNNRNTPFTAVDLTIFKSTIPVLQNYFTMAQIVMILILLVLGIFGLVCLYLYSPEYTGPSNMKNSLCCVALLLALLGGATFYGRTTEILQGRFDNLISGYKDYGVAYGFAVTLCDTGIDRPMDYSREKVHKLVKKTKKKAAEEKKKRQNEGEETHKPNLIFIQLESFFDITTVKGVSCSKDPLPVLHQLQKEYTAGNLKVPVYGAGTINTEFEVITGMDINYFGMGEYPYRSILHKTQCDSMAYWMKQEGYTSTAIHNNNASFYDRDYVFSNLGFDNFITSENMNIQSLTPAGWARDEVLQKEIINVMEKTDTRDYIYAISVQGHGDYPSEALEDPAIQVTVEDGDEKYRNQVEYYTNQIYEMDAFIGDLLEELADYPEEVMVIAYGDHLPSLNFESSDLKGGATKYDTPYFIWDNFGYNKKHADTDSEDVQSWQLSAKVLKQAGIDRGLLNQYHQTMSGTKHYKKNLKLLQYDMLYGAKFSLDDQKELKATTINYSLNPLEIQEVKSDGNKYLLLGEGFTDSSRVYVNGIQVPSAVKSTGVIEVSAEKIKDGDTLVIHQVSKTNEKTTLNQSEAFVFSGAQVKPLYNNASED